MSDPISNGVAQGGKVILWMYGGLFALFMLTEAYKTLADARDRQHLLCFALPDLVYECVDEPGTYGLLQVKKGGGFEG